VGEPAPPVAKAAAFTVHRPGSGLDCGKCHY